MIRVTVTPRMASGYYFNNLAQTAIAESPQDMRSAIGRATEDAIRKIRDTNRDFMNYTYVVSLEETGDSHVPG